MTSVFGEVFSLRVQLPMMNEPPSGKFSDPVPEAARTQRSWFALDHKLIFSSPTLNLCYRSGLGCRGLGHSLTVGIQVILNDYTNPEMGSKQR